MLHHFIFILNWIIADPNEYYVVAVCSNNLTTESQKWDEYEQTNFMNSSLIWRLRMGCNSRYTCNYATHVIQMQRQQKQIQMQFT